LISHIAGLVFARTLDAPACVDLDFGDGAALQRNGITIRVSLDNGAVRKRNRNREAIECARCRTLNIFAVQFKFGTMARAFEAFVDVYPLGQAAQMRAHTVQREEATLRVGDP